MSRMTEEETWAFLSRNREGIISTNGKDGYPYAVPVNYVVIDRAIYIHGRGNGDKAENILSDPRCCFTVMDPKGFEITGPEACNVTTVYESAVVRGRASVVEGQDEKKKVLTALVDCIVPDKKGSVMNMDKVAKTSVFRIDPVSVTGKQHVPMAGHNVVGNHS